MGLLQNVYIWVLRVECQRQGGPLNFWETEQVLQGPVGRK